MRFRDSGWERDKFRCDGSCLDEVRQDHFKLRKGNLHMEKKKYRCGAVVLAAGSGKRMGSSTKKQYLLMGGKPVLYYSLKAFEDSFIDEIILVTGAEDISYCQQELVEKYGFTKVSRVTEGGKERYHSVACGLTALSDCDYIFIHDGARPFVTGEILERCLTDATEYGACVAGMPVKDTIKIADAKGMIRETPDRNLVWMVQTPQVFDASLIRSAYQKLLAEEEKLLQQGIHITDDAMVVETLMRHPVKLTEGSYQNIKITTPEDMRVAESFLAE